MRQLLLPSLPQIPRNLGEVSKGRRGLVLISSSLYNYIWIGKIAFPRRKHLHRARLELGDQRLRVERVVRQQVRGGFGEVPGDEGNAHRRRLGDGGA